MDRHGVVWEIAHLWFLAWTLLIAAVAGVAMLVPGISSVGGLRLVYTVFDGSTSRSL